MSKFQKSSTWLLGALLLVLAACGGGSMSPQGSAVTQTSPTAVTFPFANNTSAAGSFIAQQNGNAGAGNISKVSIRNALKLRAGIPIWAHLVVWFGQPSHMNVGYDSADPSQVRRQLDDMQSRGIQGAIIDWYGTDPTHAHEDDAANAVMQDAQDRGSFQFAIMEDAGGGPRVCAQKPDCNVTQQVVVDLNYILSHYASSPAYIRVSGQPAIFFFGSGKYAVDWDAVRGQVHGNPLFIFEDVPGFQHPQTNGAFSWVHINRADPDDWGQTYLDSFYAAGLEHARDAVIGSAYKGFNDTLASWSANRVINQHCGRTWLTTLDEIRTYYAKNPQLTGVQLVTWNDYEEATEIETGIDNCVRVTAKRAGNMVVWQIEGGEDTIDHYTLWSSNDGNTFARIRDVKAGVHSADLSSADIPQASGVKIYVQAVGRASLTNHISDPVAF